MKYFWNSYTTNWANGMKGYDGFRSAGLNQRSQGITPSLA